MLREGLRPNAACRLQQRGIRLRGSWCRRIVQMQVVKPDNVEKKAKHKITNVGDAAELMRSAGIMSHL